MGFQGVGRVFTPEQAKVQKQAEAHRKTRCHDGFAKAVDLEWLLLRPWQHKSATRSAYGDAKNGALPRFLIADRLERGDHFWPIAVPGVLAHGDSHQGAVTPEGFGSLRRPFGLPPREADPGLAGREARTRHNRN